MEKSEIRINFTNDQNLIEPNADFLEHIIRTIIDEEFEPDNYEISLILVNDEKIKDINRAYRGIDSPTDVLSFSFLETADDFEEEMLDLGEIYISTETILKQSTEWNNTPEQELYYMLIHGLLHICGYDHVNGKDEERKMFARQDAYFKRICG